MARRKSHWGQVLVPFGIAFAICVLPAPAHASGHLGGPFDDGTAIALGVVTAVVPNETGLLVSRQAPDFVLGWSWQIPFTASLRHRVIGSVAWVPASDEHRLGGRLGYRFATRYLISGLGVAFDHSGVTWSPELGVKFAHATPPDADVDLSLHFVVRADITPAFGEFRTLSLLVGWNLL